MLVLSDALAMVLWRERGFRAEEFANFHPGGALGRSLLTKVCDIMRPLDTVASVGPEESIADCLKAMTDCRSGATLVVDPVGILVGIFTHGDFARAYQEDPGLGKRPVREMMTESPVSVDGEKLAAEAVRILEEWRIDDLPVVDDQGRAMGLIDTQDLGRLRLV